MGIPGLTKFISNNSEHFLVDYELHDTYLVIDGYSITYQLYNANYNYAFGGDYDIFGQCVSKFFDELKECNVTPLVLFDGGSEEKKLKTIITRYSEKIRRTSHYTYKTSSFRRQKKCFPLLMKEVFKDILREKGISYVQCMFEADNTIAAIARILKCPVLSYDSDFYMSGSLYIPFDTLQNDIVRNPADDGYVKLCKIYDVEKLFHLYCGLNQSLLPLATVLLGNDYVKQRTFINFFRHLKLLAGRKVYSEQDRIHATFDWLRRYSLDQAITKILSRLPKEKRQHALHIIETTINSYSDEPHSLLAILGVPAEKFSKTHMQDASKIYKFEGDIHKLIYIKERMNKINISEREGINEQEATNILQKIGSVSNESLVNNLPEWFIKKFKMGKYPRYFIDLIIRKLYIFPVQVENYNCKSSGLVGLQIINVIYGLLISEIDKEITSMKFIIRSDDMSENMKIMYCRLVYNDDIFSCKLPSLSNLIKTPITIRREILNTTLGITDENCVKDFPSEWMLYVAVMKYWIDQREDEREEKRLKFNYYTYSLLFTMLYNIIDSNIGVYRDLDIFEQKFYKTIQDIQSTRKMENYRPQYSMNVAISSAISAVNKDDCLIAAPFFISNFEIDDKLYSQPKKFNVKIVHGFAEFQHCLMFSMHLNALLGCPYRQIKIAKLFNGTLLYNLYNNFEKCEDVEDVETYINSVLHDSPSLERLFNILLLKFKSLSNKRTMRANVRYERQNPE